MTKPLHIGMIGCGFMGRAHSNAYLQVNHFFHAPHQPRAESCLRDRRTRQAGEVRQALGLRVDGDRLAEAHRPGRHRPDRRLRAEQHAPRDRDRRGQGRQDGRLREAAGHERRRGRRDGGRGREGRRAQHGLVQLPPRAGHPLAKQIIDEGRIGRTFHYRATYNQDYTISADVPQGGMALWRLDAKVAGSGVTGDLLAHSHRHGRVAQRPHPNVVAP